MATRRTTVSPAPSRIPSPEPVNAFATTRPVKSSASGKPKIAELNDIAGGKRYLFECPGCGYGHGFEVPRWKWNGSLTSPTFHPSLVVNRDDPATRCHLTMTDGRIQFLQDSWHKLAGQMVDVPDWEE